MMTTRLMATPRVGWIGHILTVASTRMAATDMMRNLSVNWQPRWELTMKKQDTFSDISFRANIFVLHTKYII